MRGPLAAGPVGVITGGNMTRATDFLIRASRLGRARAPAPAPAAEGCEVACGFFEPARSAQPRPADPLGCSPGTFRLSGPGGAVLHVPLQASGAVQMRVTEGTCSGTGAAGEVTFVCGGDADRAARVSLRIQTVSSAPSRSARWMSGHDPDRTTCVVIDEVPYALGRANRALVLERSADFDLQAPAWMYTSLRLSSAVELVVSVYVDDADHLFEHLAAIDALLDAIRVCRHSLSPAPVTPWPAAPRPVPRAWFGGPSFA